MKKTRYPRRVFLKGTTAAAVAIALTTDAKQLSGDQEPQFVDGPGDTGHVYIYMQP